MGSGKTTVGQLLAKKLNRKFVDADREIEAQRGMPITEIFRSMGEAAFRRMERDFMLDLCRKEQRAVVALGGGAFMQEEIRDACLSSATVVFLDIGWTSWLARHELLMKTRPLLQNRPIEDIRAMFDARRQVYLQSHITIQTDDLRPEEICARIMQSCKFE